MCVYRVINFCAFFYLFIFLLVAVALEQQARLGTVYPNGACRASLATPTTAQTTSSLMRMVIKEILSTLFFIIRVSKLNSLL